MISRASLRLLCLPACLWVSLSAAASAAALNAESIEQTLDSGPVSVRLTLTPESPVIGDTLTLSIEVTAEEGVEILMPDFGDALDRFSIVDFAPREIIDDQARTIATQTYRLDPPSSGRLVIPPILIEYVDRRPGKREAPEGFDAYEVLTDRMPFEVASVLPTNTTADLKPPLGRLQPRSDPTPSAWPWFLGIGAAVLIAAPFLYRAIAAARRRQRRRSAYEVARSRLHTILAAPRKTHEEIDRFYVGLSFAIRQYIEDRFEMRAPELTTEEFLSSISQSPDFSREHQGLLREFLGKADLVKFARAEPTESEMTQAITTVEKFLEETRENAPLLTDEADEQAATPLAAIGPTTAVGESTGGSVDG